MVHYDNHTIESLFNSLFTDPDERRLKIIRYNPRGLTPSMVQATPPDMIAHYEDSIRAMEENLKKAKDALNLIHLINRLDTRVEETDI